VKQAGWQGGVHELSVGWLVAVKCRKRFDVLGCVNRRLLKRCWPRLLYWESDLRLGGLFGQRSPGSVIL
jgi:hypothetical protein